MPGIRLAAIAPVSTASSQNHLVKGERECQASTNHRLSGLPAPMWRRGAKRTGTRHAACSAPDVHVTATHTGPYPPPTDLTGADDYMKGLAAFAEPIVAGSVRELAGVGDDRNALITLDLQAAFDPSGPAVPAPCARLYLVENGKIKTEQVVFYVGQG